VRGWGTWGHAIQWRLVNSGAARQFLQARRESPGETDENGYKARVLWREVAGRDGPANRPSTVPLPTPDQRRCSCCRLGSAVPGVSHSFASVRGLQG
jgi:hypothetical protein